MDKVNIILTTFNGEKYLPQLLSSLLAQTYRNIDVCVRDDGSTDQTRTILAEYATQSGDGVRIRVLEDRIGNLGYTKNFLRVIRASGDADYYAFCDQDDVWLPDKIERAVDALRGRPTDKCLLYTSGYEVRDEALNFAGKGHAPTPVKRLDVGKSLSLYDGGWLLGFTLVMNRRLKQAAFDNDALEMYSHDIWAQAVTAGFGGELVIDEKVTAYYRRHEGATSVAESDISNSLAAAWRYRLREFSGRGEMFQRLRRGIDTYAALFADRVPTAKDRDFLRRFADGGDGKKHIFRKMLYPHRLKQSLPVELAWRFSILAGKL